MHPVGCMIPPTGREHVCTRRVKRLGNPMVVYCISKGQKLFLRRVVVHLPLWHPDPALACQLDEQQAQTIAEKLRQADKSLAEIGVEES